MGNAHPNAVPYQEFATADSSMILVIGNDDQFVRFCHAVDRPVWAQDVRFATNAVREVFADPQVRARGMQRSCCIHRLVKCR